MSLKLYNTSERQVVEFRSIEPGKASLYCCGPTVYNFAHIGNLRTYVFEDVLRRTLEYLGWNVHHVMNVTDVGHLTGDADDGEDKMVKSSLERGMTVWEIARFYTEAFELDARRLNILPPQTVCKATDHIEHMIRLIERLEVQGFTYCASGNVYFDTSKFPSYGKMALLDRQEQPAVSRVELDSAKKNPRDFVLWFTQSKFGDQAMMWDSPWGRGYPGWHIECSAMSMHYLGDRFDIHCGGIDHVPIHHTNEIAQSEAATGSRWVNYWLHGEFLLMKDAKMSKTGGEFLTVSSLIEKGYEALDYRFLCLGAHYRSPLVFTFEALQSAQNARKNLFDKVREFRVDPVASSLGDRAEEYRRKWVEALETDLAMPSALSVVWALVKDANVPRGEKLALLFEMDRVLGLGLASIEAKSAPVSVEIPPNVQELVDRRVRARKEKDWKLSDALRDELKSLGWALEDSPQGPQLRKMEG